MHGILFNTSQISQATTVAPGTLQNWLKSGVTQAISSGKGKGVETGYAASEVETIMLLGQLHNLRVPAPLLKPSAEKFRQAICVPQMKFMQREPLLSVRLAQVIQSPADFSEDDFETQDKDPDEPGIGDIERAWRSLSAEHRRMFWLHAAYGLGKRGHASAWELWFNGNGDGEIECTLHYRFYKVNRGPTMGGRESISLITSSHPHQGIAFVVDLRLLKILGMG